MVSQKWSKKIGKIAALCVASSIFTTSYAAPPSPIQVVAAQTGKVWEAGQVYLGGDRVSYNGKDYEAKWWTQNDKPDISNQWGVWKLVGDQVEPETPVEPEKPVEPDKPEESQGVKFEITSDWGSGFNYSMTVNNTDSKVLQNWKLEFDYSGDLTSAWDVMLTKSGNHYTVTPNSWNKDISANGSVTFGGGGTKVGQISNIKLNGSAITPPVDPEKPVDPVDPIDPIDPTEKPKPGEALTDAQLQALWGGIDSQFSAEHAVGKLEKLLSEADFEALFPYRNGSKLYNEYNNTNLPEYYTYEGLRQAVAQVANVKYKIETRGGAAWNTRVWRLDKTTKKQVLVSDSVDFDVEWNANKPIVTEIVDFGAFLSEGTEKDRKREIAAFLANVAHETGGGWPTAPGGEFAWGLYYKEEVNHSDDTVGGYSEPNAQFPPTAGKSYHGRGPIQLSYNYNYGLMSAILYGDKDILLKNPEKVSHDPVVGYATAISFWMAPQGNKPSCHEVMAGTWVPTPTQIEKGCTVGCFGVTINIINGGLEAGRGEEDGRIKRRAGHYRMITSKMGVDITGEQLTTVGMKPL